MTRDYYNLVGKLNGKRNFQVDDYLEAKTGAMINFFRQERIDSVVIGLSGGIDSAVVLALLMRCVNVEGDIGPLKRVVAISMPMYCNGATGQDEAVDRATEMASLYKDEPAFEFKIADLTTAFVAYTSKDVKDCERSRWAFGQLVSVIRTPYLYYQAAGLQDEGFSSIVVGTTNRDEGSYIGFYGKASDGMVDLQPIADLHKLEVYDVALKLKIPNSIMDSVPKGDVYDGSVDEEMIGSTYEFLGLYLMAKEFNMVPELIMVLSNESDDIFAKYIGYIRNIERLHNKNRHKYKVGMPSRFVNVLNSKIEGGWQC